MTLNERLSASLIDIESRISRVRADSRAQIDALQAKKDQLQAMNRLITPEIEQAFAALKALGIEL